MVLLGMSLLFGLLSILIVIQNIKILAKGLRNKGLYTSLAINLLYVLVYFPLIVKFFARLYDTMMGV